MCPTLCFAVILPKLKPKIKAQGLAQPLITTTNPNSPSTYYVPAFNTDPSNCAIKDCIKPPPPGLLFAEKTGCEIKVCTNAPAGRYYTQVLEERTAYLKTMQCPVARCSPPKPDRRFVPG